MKAPFFAARRLLRFFRRKGRARTAAATAAYARPSALQNVADAHVLKGHAAVLGRQGRRAETAFPEPPNVEGGEHGHQL
jgi:hypothetical protein